MIASRSSADLSAAHPWCESPVPPHTKGALLDWDLVTVEAIWVKWTHYHVQETSLWWFELCDIILLEEAIRRWIHCSQTWSATIGCGLWRLNNSQFILWSPKCAKKYIPHTVTLRRGRMDPCFHVLYAKFWPYHLNVAAEIEAHQTRQRFSNLLSSNFGEPVRIVAFVSCS